MAALQSIVPGSTLTCTSLRSGDSEIYAAWVAWNTFTYPSTINSIATFSIDGSVVDTWDSFGSGGYKIFSQYVDSTGFGARYPLTGGGAHTYTITVTTASTGNPFTVLWMGSPSPSVSYYLGTSTANPPRVAVGGVIRQEKDANSVMTAAFNNLALQIATQFQSDGADVFPVNVRNYVDLDYATTDSDMEAATLPNGLATVASTTPGLHPNGSLSNGVMVGGHPHIADAFLAQMPPPPPNIAAALHLANNIQEGSPTISSYTLQSTDSLVYVSSYITEVQVPTMIRTEGCPQGLISCLTSIGPIILINNGTGYIQLGQGAGTIFHTIPLWLGLGESISLFTINGTDWFREGGTSPNGLALSSATTITSNYTITPSIGVYNFAANGVTLTLPNLQSLSGTYGKTGPYFISNTGLSGDTSLNIVGGSGATLHNIPSSLPIGCSIGVVNYGSGWYTSSTLNCVPPISATTTSLGGSALAANACSSTTTSVAGAINSMTVSTTPVTDPNTLGTQDFDWYSYVSAIGVVTTKVCALVAGTPASTPFNLRVIQ